MLSHLNQIWLLGQQMMAKTSPLTNSLICGPILPKFGSATTLIEDQHIHQVWSKLTHRVESSDPKRRRTVDGGRWTVDGARRTAFWTHLALAKTCIRVLLQYVQQMFWHNWVDLGSKPNIFFQNWNWTTFERARRDGRLKGSGNWTMINLIKRSATRSA